MAAHTKNVSRINDIYPNWQATAVNNTGADLAVGDIVILDWTSEGDNASLISPSSTALLNTHMKCVVAVQPNQSGIPAGKTGTVVIQGVVPVGLATGNAFTKGDPITITTAPNATDNSLAQILSVTAPGTNSTYIQKTAGASLVTTASLGTAQTMVCFFDGTDINAVFMKD